MKINFNQPVKSYDGQEIKDGTYKDIVLSVLNAPQEAEPSDSKMLTFGISVKVSTDKEVELSHKECQHIIEKAEKNATPLALGRIKELLGESKPE